MKWFSSKHSSLNLNEKLLLQNLNSFLLLIYKVLSFKFTFWLHLLTKSVDCCSRLILYLICVLRSLSLEFKIKGIMATHTDSIAICYPKDPSPTLLVQGLHNGFRIPNRRYASIRNQRLHTGLKVQWLPVWSLDYPQEADCI